MTEKKAQTHEEREAELKRTRDKYLEQEAADEQQRAKKAEAAGKKALTEMHEAVTKRNAAK